MSRCLVTGYKGYIGSHLYNRLKDDGHDLLGIDQVDGDEFDLSKMFESGNKTNELINTFDPEYVFHLACWPRVQYSVENPALSMRNNVLATSNLLEAVMSGANLKRVIYSGSSSVVGNGYGPTNPYGLQKLVSEMECKLYSDLYGIDTVTLRYFNVYSKDQKADSAYATAIANWMKYILEGKTPFITGSGEQRRDMLHVKDAVSANIFAMKHSGNFGGESFDVGTGDNISLNEIKEMVLKHNPNILFNYTEERPGDVMFTLADISGLSKLGWETEVLILDGVYDCFSSVNVSTDKTQEHNYTSLDRYPAIFNEVSKFLCNKDELNILSFGCSIGLEPKALIDKYFTKDNHKVVGIDIDKGVIDIANNNYSEEDRLSFFVCDNLKSLHTKNEFDAIFAMSVLCRYPKLSIEAGLDDCSEFLTFDYYNKIVMELDLLLKKDGYLIIYNSNFYFEDTELFEEKYSKIKIKRRNRSPFDFIYTSGFYDMGKFDSSNKKKLKQDDEGVIFKKMRL